MEMNFNISPNRSVFSVDSKRKYTETNIHETHPACYRYNTDHTGFACPVITWQKKTPGQQANFIKNRTLRSMSTTYPLK